MTATEVEIRQRYAQDWSYVYRGVYDYGRCYTSGFPGWSNPRCLYWIDSGAGSSWTSIDIEGEFHNGSINYQQHAWNYADQWNGFYYGCHLDHGALPYRWQGVCAGGRT